VRVNPIPVVLTVAILVAGVFVSSTVAAVPPSGKAKAAWQVLIYLDADNNLDVYAGAHHLGIVQVDLDELMAVGSSDSVAVYALVDRWYGPANLFKVLKGSLEEQTRWALNGQEVNMGDPATLRSFVAYTSKASKAEHTLLVFWDHGTPNYVAWDDNTGVSDAPDTLTHKEVVAALSGYHVDVIAADECLVGQIEVAYEYYATGLQTDYLVASEGYTGWRGYPYDAILEELTENPAMSARELSIVIVEETYELFAQPPYMSEVVNSHTAVDLGEVQAVADALRGLTELMVPEMKSYAGIVTSARGGAQLSWGQPAISFIDLERFLQGIADAAVPAEIRAASLAALEALSAAVIGIQATHVTEKIVGGLGIYLSTQAWNVAWYEEYAFASQGWLDFLQAYWAANG